MDVLATRQRMDDQDGAAAAAGVPLVPLPELLAKSDFVSLHLPLSPASQHIQTRALVS